MKLYLIHLKGHGYSILKVTHSIFFERVAVVHCRLKTVKTWCDGVMGSLCNGMKRSFARIKCSLHMLASNARLLFNIFCGLRYLKRFVAKDIQSRCRNLREMKDVFKELKVLGRKKEKLHCTN